MIRLARIGTAVSALLMLAACGFTPLYAEPGVSPTLSRISVSVPDTRVGYELRQALEDELAWDRGQTPLWRLQTDVEQRRVALGRRVDDTVSRYELVMVVRYQLAPVSGGEAITDAVTATVTYAAADQAYAAIAAQRDGEQRAVAEAARLIRLDLSRALADLNRP
ncbi:MAG: LPS assembly lipoprotein LptE [Brevundimonas sp.]